MRRDSPRPSARHGTARPHRCPRAAGPPRPEAPVKGARVAALGWRMDFGGSPPVSPPPPRPFSASYPLLSFLPLPNLAQFPREGVLAPSVRYLCFKTREVEGHVCLFPRPSPEIVSEKNQISRKLKSSRRPPTRPVPTSLYQHYQSQVGGRGLFVGSVSASLGHPMASPAPCHHTYAEGGVTQPGWCR